MESVDASLALQLARAGQTRQVVLRSAFSGRLVPQDPNDEPASVLLERIRAERASAQATNGKNHKAIKTAVAVDDQRQRRGKKLAQPARAGK